MIIKIFKKGHDDEVREIANPDDLNPVRLSIGEFVIIRVYPRPDGILRNEYVEMKVTMNDGTEPPVFEFDKQVAPTSIYVTDAFLEALPTWRIEAFIKDYTLNRLSGGKKDG